jgi:ABC-type microcin C transport system permease subunit YejE
MRRKGTSTHHIVPVSIGGSDEDNNKKEVLILSHSLYHQIFNNWHPSYILRYVLETLIPVFFNVVIDIEQEPFKEFLDSFDKMMLLKVDRKSSLFKKEIQESVKQININLEKPAVVDKIRQNLKELLGLWNEEWKPHLLFFRLVKDWFTTDSETELIYRAQKVSDFIKTLIL